MKLKGKILVPMASLAIIITLILSLINYSFSVKKFEKELNTRIQLETKTVAKFIDEWLMEQEEMSSQILSDMLYFDILEDNEKTREYLENVKAENSSGIDYFVQRQGEYYISPNEEIENLNFTTRKWYQGAIDNTEFYISEPFLDKKLNKMAVTISKSFETSGGSRGVFGQNVLIGQLLDMINILDLGEDSTAFLINDDGKFLTNEFKGFKTQAGKALNVKDVYGEDIEKLIVEEQGALKDRSRTSIDGIDKFYYFADINGTDWKIGVSILEENITGMLDNIILTTSITTLLIIIISIMVSMAIAKSISDPIGEAVNILNRIGDLDLTVEVPEEYLDRSDEIKDMAETFNKIIDKLKLFMNEMANAIEENNRVYESTQESINSLNIKGEETSATTQELSAGMEEATATTETISVSVESIYESMNEFTEIVRDISKISNDIRDHSQASNESFTVSRDNAKSKYTFAKNNIEEAIESAKEVEKISMLTDSITEIADQTTLLSLNAAIKINGITKTISSSIQRLIRDNKDLIRLMEDEVMKDYEKIVSESVQSRTYGVTLSSSVEEILERAHTMEINVASINDSILEIAETIEESTKGTVSIAEKNVSMVDFIHNINEEMDHSKEVSNKLKELMSEVAL